MSLRHTLIVVFLLPLQNTFGAVDEWFFLKEITYRQTADDTVPTQAAIWRVEVAVVTDNESDANTVTLSGGGGGPVTLEYDDGEWYYGENFESRAAMDARFPDGGNLTLTLSGGTLGTLTQNFNVGPANYPSTPYLTGNAFSSALNVLPGQGLTLEWNDPNPTADLVFIELDDPIRDDELLALDFEDSPLAQSATIPANFFTAGWGYKGLLSFLGSEDVAAGGFGVGGTVEHSASLEFESHQLLTASPAEIVGAWQFGDPSGEDSGVVVFQADGTYVHIEDVTPGDGRSDGVEIGTYTLNPNGSLTVNVTTDTNGDVGLSDPNGIDQVTIEDGVLTVTDDNESSPLTRVDFVPGNPIVGGWRIVGNGLSPTAVLVFLENGYYFHGEFAEPGDPTGSDGMERGTYSVANGILTATPIIDTNDELGLSDPMIGYDDLNISDNVAMKIFDGEAFYLHRVSNAAISPDWRITKGRSFNQSAANVAPTDAIFWDLYASVDTRNAGDAGEITLSDGGLSTARPFDNEGEGEWSYEKDFLTQTALEAEFADNQTFTITVSGGELGTRIQTINLGSEIYPPAPFLTDAIFDDIQSYPYSEEITVFWNNPSDSATQLIISSEPNEDGEEYFEELSLQGSNTSATVPANSLPRGATVYGYLEFSRVSNEVTGTGGFGVSGFSARVSTTLDLVFKTLGSDSAELNNAFTSAGLSGEESRPEATPFNDGVDNLLKYAFNMNLNGSDSSTLAEGGSSGLPTFNLGNEGGQPTFDLKFVRRTGSTLTYTPQRSDTLGNFATMTGTVTITPIPGTDFERVQVSEPCDPAVIRRCFGRVLVSLP